MSFDNSSKLISINPGSNEELVGFYTVTIELDDQNGRIKRQEFKVEVKSAVKPPLNFTVEV